MDTCSQAAISAIAAIDAVPRMLDAVCRTSGLGFAAIARVTETRWICCASRDTIGFGMTAGAELPLETTICNEIRQSGFSVIIDHVAADPRFRDHPTPALYRFQSYISVPIVRRDGSMWGTLCAVDPNPALLKTPEVMATFELFAELIAFHLDSNERLLETETALRHEQQQAVLREQFIAVLGHDLRSPLQGMLSSLDRLERRPDQLQAVVPMLRRSARRMMGLVGDILDFARARLGQRITAQIAPEPHLLRHLEQVLDEVRSSSPRAVIHFEHRLSAPVWCDAARLAQLTSNLLINAVKFGNPDRAIQLRVETVEDQLVLSVANWGNVIAPSTLARLFEPYFRGDALSGHEGLGLGLYIVAEIARAHGGEVSATSEQDLTRFTFRMPLRPAA